MAEFRSEVEVQVWPTYNFSKLGTRPVDINNAPYSFSGSKVDIDAELRLEGSLGTGEVVLWNIGDPAAALATFRRDFLIAVKMNITAEGQPPRSPASVFGKIKSVKILREGADLGYRIQFLSIPEALNDYHVQASFQNGSEGVVSLNTILLELTRKVGLPSVTIDIDREAYVKSFTADGPLSEMILMAGEKAGVRLGVFPNGLGVIISNRFLAGTAYEISEQIIFSLEPHEENWLLNDDPEIIAPEEEVSELPKVWVPEEEDVVAEGAPPDMGYLLRVPLLPWIMPGQTVVVWGRMALSSAGLVGIERQFFDVLKVKHVASSQGSAGVDETELSLALAPT